MPKSILYDSTLCVGCRACEAGCAEKWGLPYDDTIAEEEVLSAHKLTAVQAHGDQWMRRLCMHCGDPSCASACPVGALQKTELGPVVYDESRCMGCRYCMVACPFQVPTYEWDRPLPRVRKCDLCYERQARGEPTACAEACPLGATISGDRDDMIAEAWRRMAENPAQYNGGIYGLQEVGGTSVLILAGVPFEQLGLKTSVGDKPLPPLTGVALSMVPNIVAVGATMLGGIWWITHRREEVARAEAEEQAEEGRVR